MPVSLDRSSSALYAATADRLALVVEFERMPLADALASSVFTLVSLPIHSPIHSPLDPPLDPPIDLPIERPDPLPAAPADPGSSDDGSAALFQRPARPDVDARPERSERLEHAESAVRVERSEPLQRLDRPDLPRSERVAPTVDQTVDKLMERFDTNDNGSVTLTEFGSALDRGGRHPEIGPVVKRLFDHLDSDDNGSLSAAEFRAPLARLDHDGDGRLGWGEAPPMVAAELVALVGVLLHAQAPGLGG